MEQITYEGTEIDRCTICNGIWFDAGEIDILKNKQAAKAIDIGDEKVGKQANTMDRLPMPKMQRSHGQSRRPTTNPHLVRDLQLL